MGYYITVRDMEFCIKKENFEKALKVIKELPQHGWCRGNYKDATKISDALRAWRWDPSFNEETGDINYLYFEGEKLGDDEQLFDALAPFVEEGSYIEVSGEELALWRWCFDGKKMVEKNADIRW